ncbi:MAG: PepSY domain-containing protein [Syntrophobacteraceae bacterium]|nr:PepSY domain-containing protein [Syntrophobacteraceae bacterium]
MTVSKKCAMTLLGLFLLVEAGNASAYTGQKFAGEAKISMEQARVIALKAYPGKITDEELEREKGGSGLRYSFDIRRGKATREVGVDARTAALLENAPEGPNAD